MVPETVHGPCCMTLRYNLFVDRLIVVIEFLLLHLLQNEIKICEDIIKNNLVCHFIKRKN